MLKLVIFALLLIVIGCGSSDQDRKNGYSKTAESPEDSLFDEVMHGHDTAMAKMGKLSGYRKQVQQKLDSLSSKGKAAKADIGASLEELGIDLEKAESKMNKWMDDFSIDSAQNDVKRRIEYLRSEKIKVDDVKTEIRKVLAKADSLLAK